MCACTCACINGCVCVKACFAGALVIAATGGLAAPIVVGAGVAIGGAFIISVSAAIEQIDTKKNIKDVEKRWEQFVHEFLAKYVYYCDSEDTAKMILTHVKHVVYQEEDSYEFFRLLLGNRNPLVTEYCSSGSLYGYLEDASHIDQGYRGTREFNSYSDILYGYLENAIHIYKSYRADENFQISSHILFTILDLIKLSLTLDRNSESAASQPLRNLTDFLDIVIVVVDNLPNYCDCSRYKVKHPLTYENVIQMFDTAIRLAEMCKSEARAAEIYRTKKHEAELQIYEMEILNLYDNMIAMHETYESEIIKMYKIRIAEQIMISTRYLAAEKLEYDRHRCPLCKAFNCRCIEVCARCHRPLK